MATQSRTKQSQNGSNDCFNHLSYQPLSIFRFTNGLIIIDESNPPESLPKVNDIVDFASGTTNEKTNSVYVCQGRIVWIIKHFQILSHDQRSNPTTPLHNQSQNSSLSGSPSRGPVKRSQIEAEPSKTPVSAAKRALTFGPST